MWPRTALAPPSATLLTASCRSISPPIGPTVRPWSMGTMTVLPVLLLKILSILMDFPTFLMGEGLWGVEIKRWWLDPESIGVRPNYLITLGSMMNGDYL